MFSAGHESIRPVAVLDASEPDSVMLRHLGQSIPASVVEPKLADTVLATVHVALISVAAVLDKLGEPVVEDAAIRAVVAPVPAKLFHHGAGRQALVLVDLQEAEVKALDLD